MISLRHGHGLKEGSAGKCVCSLVEVFEYCFCNIAANLLAAPSECIRYKERHKDLIMSSKSKMPPGLKLLIGAGGIYVSFLSYGKLHEQIFKYKSEDGEKFTYAFFLQALGK